MADTDHPCDIANLPEAMGKPCPGYEAMRARAEAAEAEVARLREYLSRIARQKRTDELETVVDVEYADFEDGFDACVNVARAALAETEEE